MIGRYGSGLSVFSRDFTADGEEREWVLTRASRLDEVGRCVITLEISAELSSDQSPPELNRFRAAFMRMLTHYNDGDGEELGS